MKKHITLFSLLFLLPVLIFAQKHTIRGTITDANSGETLIGATISYGEGKGVVSDMDGRYFLALEKGAYHLKVSYVGYVAQESDVTIQNSDLTQDFQLKTPTLTEVEVVADVAKTRETPVAFSTIQPIQLQEELASRDIPMILNKTPGVYATQQGGGDGDARINIRGFSQRNLAVMIDGIPVNDMENGWVYWSNWFGLDAVTRSIQVQRGLGVSKLALPSVGGTMNIITKGIEANMGGVVKGEVGSDGYFRTSIGVTTGLMKYGWGVTIAGSYKEGNGWADNTWTKGWFGYIKVDKRLGKHTLTFSAMGAPQEHGQRSYMKSIATFDKGYAAKLGVNQGSIDTTYCYGTRYNSNWGYLNRWNFGPNGKIMYNTPENLTQSKNYYFKPQLSFRDFWIINEKLYWSNILYASFGDGGGTGNFKTNKDGAYISSTFDMLASNGLIDYQSVYNRNMNDTITPGRSEGIIRSSVNNHRWFGLLSTFNWEINSSLTFSGGIDLRSYKGQHYGEVYDLLGGEFMRDNANKNIDPRNTNLHIGDKVYYNNDGLVRWGGAFAQFEFKKEKWHAFLNLTAAISAYQRIDYFKKKDIVVNGNTFTEEVGFGDTFYYDGNKSAIYTPSKSYTKYTSGDTLFVIKPLGGNKYDTTALINPQAYDINSSEARPTQTKWKIFPGFTVKGGVNFNLDSRNNIFINLGYLSKAPRFSNVFSNDNKEFLDAKNEIVQAFELGYSYNSKTISLNINGYLTKWNNRPLDAAATVVINGENFPANINGMDAFHKGIEIEFGWKPIPSLQWDQVLSIGDWKWTSADTAYVYDGSGNLLKKFYFNAKGVHVGDAAQIQFMESIRWEIIPYLYLSGSFTLFGKNYAQMDPASLDPINYPNNFDANGNPRDSWQVPIYYLVDLNAGYRFIFNKLKLDIRASVLNVFDKVYISDAKNNDSYSVSPNPNSFDATSAGVFLGPGRTFNCSVALTY
ncbi:MAG: TonB-dependent receptor [Bacteroidetes bacterium]|nr:TonB-dependent receptor [Bacteroidota bacterium]